MAYGNGLDIDSLLMWLMKQTASHVIALKLFLVLAILYFIYIIILARDVAVNKTKMLIFDGFFCLHNHQAKVSTINNYFWINGPYPIKITEGIPNPSANLLNLKSAGCFITVLRSNFLWPIKTLQLLVCCRLAVLTYSRFVRQFLIFVRPTFSDAFYFPES